MWQNLRAKRGVIAAFLIGVMVAGASTATAASLITSKNIKNGTIKLKDLSPQVRALISQPGPAGATGPTGATGLTGTQGPAGVPGGFSTDNITIVTGNVATYPIPFLGGAVPQSNAECPVGKIAIGGWYEMQGIYYSEPAPFVNSYRQPAPRIWSVNLAWPDTYPDTSASYVAKAVCAG